MISFSILTPRIVGVSAMTPGPPVTDHEITARLRQEETQRLKRLLRLYTGDARALRLIRAELKRRKQTASSS